MRLRYLINLVSVPTIFPIQYLPSGELTTGRHSNLFSSTFDKSNLKILQIYLRKGMFAILVYSER